jgi:hypothetical protein
MKRPLILALTLTGCAPALAFRVEGATPEEQRVAEQKAAEWNAHTTAKKRITFSPSGKWLLSFVDRIPTASGDVHGRRCTVVGEDCERGRWVRVVHGLAAERLLRVLGHELGHAVGLEHIDEDGPLMSGPGRNGGTQITERDITECRRVGACAAPRKAP